MAFEWFELALITVKVGGVCGIPRGTSITGVLMVELYFEKPGSRLALREGELAKLGIKTDGAVLSGGASLVEALEGRSRYGGSLAERAEVDRARQLVAGLRRR